MNDATSLPAPLIDALRAAQRIAILTGAGVSAESGLRTYREPQTGLWAEYRPEDLATPAAFRRNPQLVWDWFAQHRATMAQAQPNPAHRALAAIERAVPHCTLITQNIDGLHQRAGSRNVIELHGNVARTRCADEGRLVDTWGETDERPPRCPSCGGLLRPDVIWFGELIPEERLAAALDAARTCDLFLSIGTSSIVEPAASLAYRAMEQGATVAVINLDVATSVVPRYVKLHGRAGEVLPALVAAAWPDL